ncbi:protein tyrosine phosphatase [Sphingobacteriaceae bacterium WQ 2009]|uniref:protein-tyrosine-phosphatase n=1 Tax=Rhinopithecimicrobium faecis TaxID=2820698 RepID=A0A8T4HBL2_9SPHI|nr:protein tyrosine phosphatase [Sphingobacteriaceae bacterium WQ 2009]
MNFLSKIFSRKSKNNQGISGGLEFLEIDMHNHILPGIDDGAKSVEDSTNLILGLKNLGIKNFICTPHIMDLVHPNNNDIIAKSYNQLIDHLLNQDISTKGISYSAEYMIDEGLTSIIQSNSLIPMPNNYVLIEMSYLSESKSLFKTIMDIQSLGYKPILAHPERYNYYHNNFNIYKQIKDAGCDLQLNLLSISSYYGISVKTSALALIKSGMYDFVGTDTHHERHLNALNDVVKKYPIKKLLDTCNIKNQDLINTNFGNERLAIVG